MATQSYPIFKITATLPTVGQQTGVFEMKKATATETIRTGFLVENRFADVFASLGDIVNDDQGGRRGINVDAGGGQHVIEVDAEIRSGDDGQWGYSSNTNTLDEGTASGGDRTQKAQVLQNYLLYASPDSITPATLEYGERAPGGEMPTLDVYVEDPSIRIPRDQSTTAAFSARFISTIDLSDNAVTSLARTD